MNTKFKKPYKLSLNGIFYIILNDLGMPNYDLVRSLIRNYKNNVLFSLFLHPFIEEQTILAGWTIDLFNIITYLKDICYEICKYIKHLKNNSLTTEDGYIIKQVFFWTNNMENDLLEIQKFNLQIFIRNTLKWNWINNAEIIPKINENEHLIEIRDRYNPQHRLYISIHKDEKKAVLRQNGIKYYEFSVTSINNSSISIETKTNRKRIKSIEPLFTDNCEQHLSGFLI